MGKWANDQAPSVLALSIDDTASAYEGRAGRCACGCSGTYWGPEYVEPTTTAGVAGVHARNVERILRRIQRHVLSGGEVGSHVFADGSACWYYETKSRLTRVESRPGWTAR